MVSDPVIIDESVVVDGQRIYRQRELLGQERTDYLAQIAAGQVEVAAVITRDTDRKTKRQILRGRVALLRTNLVTLRDLNTTQSAAQLREKLADVTAATIFVMDYLMEQVMPQDDGV